MFIYYSISLFFHKSSEVSIVSYTEDLISSRRDSLYFNEFTKQFYKKKKMAIRVNLCKMATALFYFCKKYEVNSGVGNVTHFWWEKVNINIAQNKRNNYAPRAAISDRFHNRIMWRGEWVKTNRLVFLLEKSRVRKVRHVSHVTRLSDTWVLDANRKWSLPNDNVHVQKCDAE